MVNPVAHPQDTRAVARAKAQHEALYQQIALQHSQPAAPAARPALQESAAVASQRQEFSKQFAQIAAEHARIAAEHAERAEQNKRDRAERSDAIGLTFRGD